MNPISDIKRFLLRAIGRANGMPWPDALLNEAARQGTMPRPLQSDINQAKRELESAGYIQGARDELDDLLTWTLTDKGRHKARQLG
jgi:DNA-binding MarR family transcriptional regulator